MQGEDCCSDLSISFHYVEPMMMRLMDFMLYNLDVSQRNKPMMKENTIEIIVSVVLLASCHKLHLCDFINYIEELITLSISMKEKKPYHFIKLNYN